MSFGILCQKTKLYWRLQQNGIVIVVSSYGYFFGYKELMAVTKSFEINNQKLWDLHSRKIKVELDIRWIYFEMNR